MKDVEEVRADETLPPQIPTILPMAEVIEKLLNKVADAIDEQLETRANIRAAGGPYENSLLIVQERKLKLAAVAAITTIINDPSFHKPPN